MTSKHVIVVGAGIAGLTAAYRIQQQGHEVHVLEARPYVGGRMITIDWDDIKIDPGAEFVTGADKYLFEMLTELGIKDKLINYSDEQTGFYVGVMRDGEVHKVNFMSIMSYLTWSGVSFGARLSMLKLLPYIMRYKRADVFHPENTHGDDNVNMERFFYEKINPEMFEYWVQPTMDVFCSYTSDDLSAKMLLLLFGSYLSQKLYTFAGGIGTFPNALADQLDIACKSMVSSVEIMSDGSGAIVHYIQGDQPRIMDADGVVVAVPGDIALSMLGKPRPAWKSFFPKVRYTRVGVVFHIVEGDESFFDEGGIMFPRKEPWKLSALGWKRRPDGRVLVMSDLKAHIYDPSITDEVLIQTITSEMIRAVPEFKDRIKNQMVYRWHRKVPTFRVGYLKALKSFVDNPQEGSVYFCGDYLTGPSTGSALASGWQCADRILEAI